MKPGRAARLRLATQRLTPAAWGLLLAGFWWYTSSHRLTPLQTMQALIDFVSASPYGFLIYLLAYLIRPVFLFPAALFTMAATYLYGPVRGIAYAYLASNLATLVAFGIGRTLWGGFLPAVERHALIARYAGRLRQDSFQTTLVLRFLFVPYDLVSYFAGFLRVDWRGFLWATLLGSVPGTLTYGLLGASIKGPFAAQVTSLDPLSLLSSAAMFGVTLLLYRLVRRREERLKWSDGPLQEEGAPEAG